MAELKIHTKSNQTDRDMERETEKGRLRTKSFTDQRIYPVCGSLLSLRKQGKQRQSDHITLWCVCVRVRVCVFAY